MTATASPARLLRVGTRDLELGSGQLATLRDATPHLGDPAALRARLADEGYLLLRGLQDRDLVLEARRQMVAELRDAGVADRSGGPLDARPIPGCQLGGVDARLTRLPAFRQVVESERIRSFMQGIYGGEALTFSFKWMRVVGPGDFTGAHYDVVYMGRGSMGVLTVWTPFGDLGYEHGTLAVVPGSHRLPGYQRVRDTYGRMDVDRDRVSGWFANDPLDVTGRYGGGWATTEFRAGDVLIFGMHMMHMSLTNTSGEFRLTADTRWQKAGDPVDERWIGKLPKGHYAWHSEPEKMVAMADKRREWGV
jgi:hypothetical protein